MGGALFPLPLGGGLGEGGLATPHLTPTLSHEAVEGDVKSHYNIRAERTLERWTNPGESEQRAMAAKGRNRLERLRPCMFSMG